MTRPLLALIFAATTLTLLGGVAQSAGLPPYIRNKGDTFAVYSNRAWHSAHGTSRVREMAPKDPGSPRSADRSFYIWTEKCTPGQKFAVVRSVDLIGRPSDVSFSFHSKQQAAWTELWVNSQRVARAAGAYLPRLKPAQRRPFEEGHNEVKLVMKVQRSPFACDFVGLWFEINGIFSTDLKVGAPQPGEAIKYYKADNGRGVTVGIRITNKGPARIPEGIFEVRTTGSRFPMVTGAGGLGDLKCVNDRFMISTCPFKNMEPGQILTVVAVVTFKPNPELPSWTEESTALSWRAYTATLGPWEIDSSNNASLVGLVFCSSRSTLEGCKTAE